MWGGASIEIKRELGFHSGNICDICILIEKENTWKKNTKGTIGVTVRI